MNRPGVYIAHPVTSYGTARERTCLARIAELLPGVELVNPAGMFDDVAAWLSDWPRLLPWLDGLVVFADDGSTIGAGCWRELGDAWAAWLPVAVLHRRQLHEIAAVHMAETPWRSPARLATVEPGRRYGRGEYEGAVLFRAERRVACPTS